VSIGIKYDFIQLLNRVVYFADGGESQKLGTTSSGETSGETNRFFNKSLCLKNEKWRSQNGFANENGFVLIIV
jgi:hypothetical protein